MDWQSRVRDGKYESPNGDIVIDFMFENVSKSLDKKTTAFEFPDFNGTYVQDLGHTGRKYPLRLIFSGDTHDQQAEQLEAALIQVGIGVLTHPVWGVVDVVPFGQLSFRNDLKTAANQTIVEVTFFESIRSLYPLSQSDPASNVLTAVAEHNDTSAAAFAETIDIDTEVERVTVKSTYTALLDGVSSGLDSVASVQADVQKQFDTINASINNAIDILIAQPLALAFQTTLLIQAPARALSSISDRLEAYKNLANSIFSSNEQPANENAFRVNDLYASTAVTGSIISVVNNQFTTKVEAVEAADNILTQMDDLIIWRDDNLTALNIVDTGEAYQQLQEAVALTARFLVDISFTLKLERRLFLDADHTILDLMAELYPFDVEIDDDEINFFITSNNLVGDEILELKRGREVVYYV